MPLPSSGLSSNLISIFAAIKNCVNGLAVEIVEGRNLEGCILHSAVALLTREKGLGIWSIATANTSYEVMAL